MSDSLSQRQHLTLYLTDPTKADENQEISYFSELGINLLLFSFTSPRSLIQHVAGLQELLLLSIEHIGKKEHLMPLEEQLAELRRFIGNGAHFDGYYIDIELVDSIPEVIGDTLGQAVSEINFPEPKVATDTLYRFKTSPTSEDKLYELFNLGNLFGMLQQMTNNITEQAISNALHKEEGLIIVDEDNKPVDIEEDHIHMAYNGMDGAPRLKFTKPKSFPGIQQILGQQ